ncbi:MAG: HAD-IB family phosphatase [Microthrixaceae bacterium]|nr:HAD-IB family phosphatase [Microthrixaceae bacterium]
MIADALSAKRIFITGATGFVGTALTERILRCVPESTVVLLVRDGRRRDARSRVEREVLRNDAFDRLRDELGKDGFADMAQRRVEVVAGDVGTDRLGLDAAGLQALSTCDVVIHSAATVAFDAPLDRAVEVNLLGPVRIARTIDEAFGTHGRPVPHLVTVSTCYVAGNRRGAAPEEPVRSNPFFVDIDWQAEVAAARRTRADTDAASRHPDRLAEFAKTARSVLGPAGGPALSERTEQLRRDWVADSLVSAGRSRAASLGWPDAYALTKALGEVALGETLDGIRAEGRRTPTLSVVRPSIIESALAEPSPGWIRGFRMAEPIILSYARGLLKEFPGVPEGIVDVIPVDLVVSAILAAAANPSRSEAPDIVQVASGGINPLQYQVLVDNVRDWFLEHPLHDDHGQPIVVPDWTFPGRGRVERQLRVATGGLERVERIVGNLPLRGRAARWGAQLELRRAAAQRALSYVELYGAYTECEAVYGVDRLLELADLEARGADGVEGSPGPMQLDPRAIEWDDYIPRIHLPSVVKHGRAATTGAKRDPERRANRLRGQVLSEQRHLAAFDLENTLIASNVVSTYAWLAGRRLGTADRARLVARLLAEAPGLLAADRSDRSDFLRSFYRRYEGAPVEQIRADAADAMSDLLLSRSFPDALRRVREHRRLGHRTVLITGALDLVVEPLAPLFDDIVCAEATTEVRNGVEVLTGHLSGAPPTAEARAAVLRELCERHGLDPAESVAYADSSSDLSLLEAVGFPVAVNPEPRLATIARTRGWLIEEFDTARGHRPPLLPLAPRWGRPRQRRRPLDRTAP